MPCEEHAYGEDGQQGEHGSSSNAVSPAPRRPTVLLPPTRWQLRLAALHRLLLGMLVVPVQHLLEPLVRRLQRSTRARGLSGAGCAGLGVWNAEYRWWWWCVRELVKLAIVLVATELSLRAPLAQAMVVLLLVVLAAAASWQVQACNGTSMERLQYVSFCCLQGLAVLALLPVMPLVHTGVLGACILAVLAAMMVQSLVMLSLLVWRCVVAAKKMTRREQGAGGGGGGGSGKRMDVLHEGEEADAVVDGGEGDDQGGVA